VTDHARLAALQVGVQIAEDQLSGCTLCARAWLLEVSINKTDLKTAKEHAARRAGDHAEAIRSQVVTPEMHEVQVR
jgi:hypothetical protein